jgi:hypothetical protein
MTEQFFFQGIQHITDIDGYDHMLFLAALCAPFTLKQWKPVLFLATAFTVGHSISLALAVLDIIHFDRDLIELLIAITILITALSNIFIPKKSDVSVWYYVLTAGFGLIHGMGFSGFFRMISDDTSSLVGQLFLFNLGVEVGQVIIIFIFLILVYFISKTRVNHNHINKTVSFFAALVSAWLVLERF